jgi:hypothetical protein
LLYKSITRLLCFLELTRREWPGAPFIVRRAS